jgi:hypothetical protein
VSLLLQTSILPYLKELAFPCQRGFYPCEAQLRSDGVLYRLAELFAQRGVPQHIRSDNGPEFAVKAVRHWLARVGVQTLFITPAVRGRRAISRVSTGGYVMNCWIESCLLHSGG